MKHNLLIQFLLICALCGQNLPAAKPPSILWLSCEDISPHIHCFGDEDAITPNLDKLAAAGARFTNVYTSAGVCAPCRSGIITGMYQTSIGTHHMRCNATLPEFLEPFPMYLREAGYYCTNNSKTDYQFSVPSKTEIWDESCGQAHWRNRAKKDQPFFAVFNFTGCHESGIASESKYKSVTKDLDESQRQDARTLPLPPYYPDTPVVREDWKRNYELITAMDAWAGDLLAQLAEDGLDKDTIVMFWSDHGVGLPRAKRWLYDSGTRVPFVVRIPEEFRVANQGEPGSTDDQLVSSIDFAPTVLNLAGLEAPGYMQGRAFLGKNLSAPREYVYGARDRMDERYDIIRSVRDKRFRYIRNYEPLKPYYQYMNTPEQGATMKEIRQLQAAGELPPAAALFAADQKPLEELYDLESDPHEVKNLAADPAHAGRLAKMRAAHLRWVQDTKDLGLIPEAEIAIREKGAGSRYAILRQKGGDEMNARLGRIAALASEGPRPLAQLVEALEDEDAAVRYWAATGIGNTARSYDVPNTVPLLMAEALNDRSPCVRIAAARALCLMGDSVERALAVLAAEMESDHEWGRLQTAIVLDEIDEMARPVIDSLERGLEKQPNKYITRVANRALNELLGTENTVP